MSKFVGPIAAGKGDEREAAFLKRKIKVDPMEGWSLEPDHRHAKRIVELTDSFGSQKTHVPCARGYSGFEYEGGEKLDAANHVSKLLSFGSPNVDSNSDSDEILTGLLTGPFAKAPAIAPTLTSTVSILPRVKSLS